MLRALCEAARRQWVSERRTFPLDDQRVSREAFSVAPPPGVLQDDARLVKPQIGRATIFVTSRPLRRPALTPRPSGRLRRPRATSEARLSRLRGRRPSSAFAQRVIAEASWDCWGAERGVDQARRRSLASCSGGGASDVRVLFVFGGALHNRRPYDRPWEHKPVDLDHLREVPATHGTRRPSQNSQSVGIRPRAAPARGSMRNGGTNDLRSSARGARRVFAPDEVVARRVRGRPRQFGRRAS
jgi:hypothetical protein